MQDNKGDIRFVGFNKYTRKPIQESTAKNWVMNGENNINYTYIIERYNGSTTNKAVNNSYIDLAYGRGLSIHKLGEDSQEYKDLIKIISKKDIKAILTDNQVFGAHSFQIHRQKGDKNKIAKIEHLTKSNVIPSIENEDDGLVHSYWYSSDWKKRNQAKYRPVEYPAFGFGKDFNFEKPEIFVGKPYQIGQQYFEQPDYDASLQYAQIEEELSNYYLSHIVNGLSFGSIVNVPNSKAWTEGQKDSFIKDTNNRLSGSSNAGAKAFNFMASDTDPTTITNVENNTAHKQWDFLGNEASNKILSGHKCVSPVLVGLSASTGFSSVADEMDMMEQQLMKRVISPKQDFVLGSISEVLEFFKIVLDIYLRPLTEIEGEKEEEAKVNDEDKNLALASECNCQKKNFDFIEQYAENEPEGYELEAIDYDLDKEIKLASTAKSEQDTEFWKVRYAYNIGTSKKPKGQGRAFCDKMMKLSKAGKVFRKEDIDKMSAEGVNGQFAHEGGKYNIFFYGGGVNCHHRWERRIYKKKRREDGKALGGNAMQNVSPVNVGQAKRQGFTPQKNDKDVAIAEIDKPNKGSLK